jgi:hypothetical protein
VIVAAEGDVVLKAEEMPSSKNSALIAAAPLMRDLLRKIEWRGHYEQCPICENSENQGHAPGCDLHLALVQIA